MSRVFLTGASGFVGRQILKSLRAAGHLVTVTERPGSFQRAGIDPSGLNVIATRDAFYEEPAWWSDVLRGQDTLIHAAWYVDHGKFYTSDENLRCAAGSAALAEGAAMAGIRHLIGIGTCMEYRLPSDHLGPDAPLGPSNLYSAAKLATFFILKRHAELAHMHFSWCRLFSLFGEAEGQNRLAAYVERQLARGEVAHLSAGTQLRDYIDVAEAGRMIASVVDTAQTGVINVCSGIPVTVRQFAEGIADRYGRRDLLQFSDQPVSLSDPAAIVGICNWQAPG